MALFLSILGSAISSRSASTVGDEDGAASASLRASGWATHEYFAAEPSESAVGARIVADRFASLARRMMAKQNKTTEIKMPESHA